MKISKSQRNNIFFLVFILIIIIPQTRQPLQVLLHKGLALFSPSLVDTEDRTSITDYNWQLLDETGETFNFEDAKGKVVVINFWATWCPPCIAEMPSLEKLYNAYNEDVVFLFVSDEKHEVISKFKQKHNYQFKVYSALTAYPEVFNVSSIPRTLVIDKNGNIIIDKTGAANWYSDKVIATLEDLLP
uniref:TlpA family protein disulfide reductase n=1 Tax=Gelidibacter sp. TaxID=2018083 RepID=UPI004048F4AF